jgi:hypothetical protein
MTWVDIIRARGQLPSFNDFADETRQFLAAEILSEQASPVEGALQASASNTVPCEYCGHNNHSKKDCRFHKSDLQKGELKPPGYYRQRFLTRKKKRPQGQQQRKFGSGQYSGALITSSAFHAVTTLDHGFIIEGASSRPLCSRRHGWTICMRPTRFVMGMSPRLHARDVRLTHLACSGTR